MVNLSGIWGHAGLPFLDLRVDASGNVSGTTYWRGSGQDAREAPIARGSFDPNTHTLRLEGDAPSLDGDGQSHYVIDGTLEDDTLTGTFDVGGLTGCFTFTRIADVKE